MLRPLFPRLIVAVAAALSASASHAMDLAGWIGRSQTASSVTVFLVPPMALFNTSLGEAQMQAAGCRFTTVDAAAIGALATLLKAGKVDGNVVYQRPDIREGVYLTLADGGQLKLLLEDNNGGKLPVVGVAETAVGGDFERVAVTAGRTLATDVRRWAATHGGEGTGSACNRLSPVAAER